MEISIKTNYLTIGQNVNFTRKKYCDNVTSKNTVIIKENDLAAMPTDMEEHNIK